MSPGMWLRVFVPLVLVTVPFLPAPVSPATVAAGRMGEHPGLDELPPAMTGRDLRVERFVLLMRGIDARGRAHAEIAGFVEWRKRETPAGQQMECDARFLREPATVGGPRDVERVLHVECLSEKGPRCLWREVGPAMGRSVQAEWSEDGRALELVEWSAAGKKRGTLVASGGASMPLYLVELLRQGGLTAGSIVRFDPLARTLESLEVRTVWLDAGGPLSPSGDDAVDAALAGSRSDVSSSDVATDREGPTPPRAVRTVELVRGDGSLAGRFRFAGLELVAFQWQEGPLFARAVGREEFDRLTALHLPSAVGARGPSSDLDSPVEPNRAPTPKVPSTRRD